MFATVEHDFGSLAEPARLTHDYLVRNEGGADLIIDRLRSGCGCTAKVTPPVIEANATGTIHADCATADTAGKLRRTVTVYSNDPKQPVRTLTLKAQVESALRVEPTQLYVGHVRRGEPIRRTIRVNGSVASTGLSTSAVLDAAWMAPDASGGRGIRLSVRHDAPPGRFTAALRIPTGNPQNPHRAVAIAGTVDPDNS